MRHSTRSEAIAALIRATSEIGRLCAEPPDIPADRLGYFPSLPQGDERPETQERAAKIGRPLEPSDGAEPDARSRAPSGNRRNSSGVLPL